MHFIIIWVCFLPFLFSSEIPPYDFFNLVDKCEQIKLKGLENTHNPSIIDFEKDKYLLVFRYMPEYFKAPWISYIGVVILDKDFKPISQPELLQPRGPFSITPSQAQDARIIKHLGEYYLIYNDNLEIIEPKKFVERRDVFIAKLYQEEGHFKLGEPLKIVYPKYYENVLWQKNWTPFVYKDELLLSYSISPHEVVYADNRGEAHLFSLSDKNLSWDWGEIRGGTQASLIDGQYVGFFHSSIRLKSIYSMGKKLIHYFIGAYVYDSEPPFEVRLISPYPIISAQFYDKNKTDSKIVFPMGFVMNGENICLAYGKNDREIWIATINRKKLLNSLIPAKVN